MTNLSLAAMGVGVTKSNKNSVVVPTVSSVAVLIPEIDFVATVSTVQVV